MIEPIEQDFKLGQIVRVVCPPFGELCRGNVVRQDGKWLILNVGGKSVKYPYWHCEGA